MAERSDRMPGEAGTVPMGQPVRQTGVLGYRIAAGRPLYLLITSRRSRRWILPKGGLIAGLSPQDSAAREALEEAGIEGEVEPCALGVFAGQTNEDDPQPVEVELFAMRVTQEHEEWREMHQRERRWVDLAEAKRLLEDGDKYALVAALEERLSGA